jgi:hypothetical protein
MNITNSDARFLVELLTYHALLQHSDMEPGYREMPERLMVMTKFYSDIYMREILHEDTPDK